MKSVLLLFLALLPVSVLRAELVLAQNDKTDYAVALKADPTETEKLAAEDLALYLGKVSGAKFLLGGEGKHKLFVGVPAPGDRKPLKRRETRIKSVGTDVYLWGEGPHGNADAVYDFLEDLLGCRWYTTRGDEYVPKKSRIAFDKLDHSRVPSFVGVALWGGEAGAYRTCRARELGKKGRRI